MDDTSDITVTEDDAHHTAINHKSIIKLLRESAKHMGPQEMSGYIGKTEAHTRGLATAMAKKGLLVRLEHGVYRLATKKEYERKKKGVKPGKQKHLQDMGEDIRGYLRQLDVSSDVVDSFVESVMNNELSEGSDMVALEGVQIEREGRLTRHTMEHANTIDLKKKRHVRVLIVVEVTEIEETPPKDKPSANKD